MEKRGVIAIILAFLVIGTTLWYFYSKYREKTSLEISLEESYNSLGWKLYREGKYDEAIAEFKKYIKRNPKNFFAHSGLGRSLYKKGIYDEAIGSFETAISINPNNHDPYNGLGWAHYKFKQYDKAILAFEKAKKLAPTYFDTYNGLGLSYTELNFTTHYWEYDRLQRHKSLNMSIEAFKKAISLNPNDDAAYGGLGWSLYWIGRGLDSKANYSEAEKAFKQAIKLNPTNYLHYNGLGWTYIFMGNLKPPAETNYTQLVTLFEKSLELKPDYWMADFGAGIAYQKLYDFNKSLEYFEKSAVENPLHSHAFQWIGFTYYMLAHDHFYDTYDKAIENLKKAIEIDEDDINNYIKLGWVLHEKGRHPEAIELFNKVLEFPNIGESDLAEAYAGLTSIYKHKGDYELALQFGEKSIEFDSVKPGYRSRQGFLYRQMGVFESGNENFAKAKEFFELANPYFIKANELQPNRFTGWLGLGWNSYSLGEFKEALLYLMKALEKNPRDAPAYEGLGRVYYSLRDYNKAIEMYKKAEVLGVESSTGHGGEYNIETLYDGLGWAYLRKGEYDKALEYFDKALGGNQTSEDNPHFKTTYLGFAYIYYKQNSLKDSAAMINKITSLKNSWPYTHIDPYHSKSFVECMKGKDYTPKNVADCIEISGQ